MTEAKSFLPIEKNAVPEDIEIFTNNKNIVAYPEKCGASFGNGYYKQCKSREGEMLKEKNQKLKNVFIYKTENLNVPSIEELENKIEDLKTDIRQENENAE